MRGKFKNIKQTKGVYFGFTRWLYFTMFFLLSLVVSCPRTRVEVSAKSDKEGYLGDTITVAFTITNTGNTEDAYTGTVSDKNEWKLIPDSFSISISSGESEDQEILVYISSEEKNLITCKVESRVHSGISDSDELSVTVKSPGDLTAGSNKKGSPGDTVDVDFSIVNTSNTTRRYGAIFLDSKGWHLEPKYILESLSPGESAKLNSGVSIPLDASPGEQDTIVCKAVAEGFEDLIWDEDSLYITVE